MVAANSADSTSSRARWLVAVWLVIAIALPAHFLYQRLPLDLWHDEAFTVRQLTEQAVAQPTEVSAQTPRHPLFESLLRFVALASTDNFALRLPSFIFALATLATLYLWVVRAAGVAPAVAAVLLLGTDRYFLNYAPQVRGHALSMLLLTALAYLVTTPTENDSHRRKIAVAALGALFLASAAANAIYFLPIVLYVVAHAWSRTRSFNESLRAATGWVSAWIVFSVFVLLFGAIPVVPSGYANSPYISSLDDTARAFFSPALRDVAWLLPFACLGLACYSLRRRWRCEPGAIALLLFPATIVGAALLANVTRGDESLTPQVYAPALPLLMAALAWLLSEFIDVIPALIARWVSPQIDAPRLKALTTSLASAALVAIIAAFALPPRTIFDEQLAERRDEKIRTDGYFDYYATRFEPSTVAEFLAERTAEDENFVICLDRHGFFTLPWYLDKHGVPLVQIHRPPEAGELPLATIYVVAPWQANWDDVAQTFGSAKNQVGYLPHLKEFPFFRVSRSTMPVPIDPDNLVPATSRGDGGYDLSALDSRQKMQAP